MKSATLASLVILLAPLCPIPARAAGPEAGFTLQTSGPSPRGDLTIEAYVNPDGVRQIWIAPVARPEGRVLLYTHQRHATVSMSPDQKHLAVNDFPSSSGGGPKLFTVGPGLEFKEDRSIDIEQKALELVAKEQGVVLAPPLSNLHQVYDHFRAEATEWGADGQTMIIHISGRGGSDVTPVADLVCTYDLRTRNLMKK